MAEEISRKSIKELKAIVLAVDADSSGAYDKKGYVTAIMKNPRALQLAQSDEPSLDEFGIKYQPRDPITEAEEKHLSAIEVCIDEIESSFWCSGATKIEVKAPFLAYRSSNFADGEVPKFGYLLFPGSAMDLNMLHDTCNPSSHGQGKELVYDESYRLAREMHPNDFTVNFDPIREKGMLESTISTFIGQPCDIKLYKLNSYSKGGFFKSHQDTPKGESHIGTLVIALNTPFEGGEFILRRGGHDFTFDWSTPKQNPDSLNWVFFYSDVEHEILPVSDGYRLTLSYDVYAHQGDLNPYQKKLALTPIDPKSLPLYSLLSNAFKDPTFLPQGGRLAFGLEHVYPLTEKGWSSNFLNYLKGSDAVLAHVLRALDLGIAMEAVYEEAFDDYTYFCNEHDEPVEIIDSRGSISKCGCFVTGSDYVADYNEPGEEPFLWSLLNSTYVDVDRTMIWINFPQSKTLSTTYAYYGNSPESGSTYVSACIVVCISPIGHRCRPVNY